MKKQIFAMILVGVMVANFFCGTTAHAATTGDYKDKIFSFYIPKDPTRDTTTSYTKYTTSSTYVHLQDSETSFAKVKTYGYINGQWVNKTIGTSGYAILQLGKQRVRNYIVEHNNYNPTSMYLQFCYYISPTVNVGVWSPDCQGTYPAAN